MSPLPHELVAGNVVLIANTPKTVLFTQNASVDNYAFWRLTFSDSTEAVVSATAQIARIHPLDAAVEPSSTTTP